MNLPPSYLSPFLMPICCLIHERQGLKSSKYFAIFTRGIVVKQIVNPEFRTSGIMDILMLQGVIQEETGQGRGELNSEI